jgi:CheY-like chemotaxis protein
MPRGGELRLGCSVAELDESFCAGQPTLEPGRFVHLCVEDTGVGMDEATMSQVFEPFFTTKDQGKGTGLGLATAYGIVQQHGGVLTVRSVLGEGSVFSIYLPAHAAATPKKQAAPRTEAAAEGGSETILLAEDDPMVRNLTSTVLKRAGYEVLIACDGEEAVQVFAEHEDAISLLLLDVVMPNLGGLEAWELIRRRNAGVPVIFASGYSESALNADLGSAEGVTVIQKPFERLSLLAEIRRRIDESGP